MSFETLKKVLKALLVSASNPMGVPLQTLKDDYQELEGQPLPYKEYGFRTEMDLLNSIWDTIEVSRGYWFIDGVRLCVAEK